MSNVQHGRVAALDVFANVDCDEMLEFGGRDGCHCSFETHQLVSCCYSWRIQKRIKGFIWLTFYG